MLVARPADRARGQAVGAQQIVGDRQAVEPHPQRRRVIGERMPVEGVHVHLVEREPVRYPVAQGVQYYRRIVGERVRRGAV